ncbi:uncharacterized protein EI97DRAFT_499289 [Westerdykella ornata]|uniref:Uncharacterized protein n=1 Tax=Westerdykella ornata TaxID=318751 RepID=A0A6A6JPZ8_WESOR|nr:uncharacterized protein EI97DRAFT_499289 [Westerdykella ornata]KAF2278701.1 hypothetical protein EI97DRAFT_499289 [Westerdykella ornata]
MAKETTTPEPRRAGTPQPSKSTHSHNDNVDEDCEVVTVPANTPVTPQGDALDANDTEKTVNPQPDDPHAIGDGTQPAVGRDISVRECMDYMDYIERLSHSILVPRKVNPRVILSRHVPSSSNPAPQFRAYVLAGEERARKNIFKVEGLIGEDSQTREEALRSLRGLVEDKAAGERYDERDDGYDQVAGDDEEAGEGDGQGKAKGNENDKKRKRGKQDKGKEKAQEEVGRKEAPADKTKAKTKVGNHSKPVIEKKRDDADTNGENANRNRATHKPNAKAAPQPQAKSQKGPQASGKSVVATEAEKEKSSAVDKNASGGKQQGTEGGVGDVSPSSESDELSSVVDEEEEGEGDGDDKDDYDEFPAKRQKSGESAPESAGNRPGLRSARTRAPQKARR